ncbi:hypothetical protein CBL_05628 [Carabus blaptoides fortunei]
MTARYHANDSRITSRNNGYSFNNLRLHKNNSDNFEELDDPMEDVTQDFVDMARQLELEVEPEDVIELAEEDLRENQRKHQLEKESLTDKSPARSREISIPELENALGLAKNTMVAFEKIDPNFERSSKVNAVITKAIACYQQLLLGKKRRTSL